MGKVKYTVRTPLLAKTPIIMHPLIGEAFEYSRNQSYQFDLSKLSAKSVQQFQLQTPLHAIQQEKKIYFFSGWHWLPYCNHFDLDTIVVFIHKKISEQEILNLAWSYLLSTQMTSYNQASNLACIKDIITQLPATVKSELLLSGYTSSEQRMVEQLTGESRSTIRNQIKRVESQTCTLPSHLFPSKVYIN